MVKKKIGKMTKKQKVFTFATTGTGAVYPVVVGTMSINPATVSALLPVTKAMQPYCVPLIAVGVGTALAYDLWHMPHGSVRKKLKSMGRWADHEIDFILSHLRHHKKKNPKMFRNIKKYHVKKLRKMV